MADHGLADWGLTIVRLVGRVATLDHAWRTLAHGVRAFEGRAGGEIFTIPTESSSRPRWGEKPRIGVVRGGAVGRVL